MSDSEGVIEILDYLVYRLGYVYLTDCFVKPCPSPCLGLLGSPSSRKSGIIKKTKKNRRHGSLFTSIWQLIAEIIRAIKLKIFIFYFQIFFCRKSVISCLWSSFSSFYSNERLLIHIQTDQMTVDDGRMALTSHLRCNIMHLSIR